MSHCEQCAEERKRLEWIIEQHTKLLRFQFDLIAHLLNRKGIAVMAKLVLTAMQNASLATFTEFDANGSPVRPSGPITFASDNPAVATIDSAQQAPGADGFSVTCPVVSVLGATGTANITGVDSAVLEAGRGMGLTDSQLLFQVELPLALSVILSGVRIAIVVAVGLATIEAAIGAGGLGEFIFRGLAMVDNRVILAGAVPAAILALLADVGVGWLERRLRAR